MRQDPQGTSDFRLRSQGPCRLGTGESGLLRLLSPWHFPGEDTGSGLPFPSPAGSSRPRVRLAVSVFSNSNRCLTLCDPWTVLHQAPLSMEFSRQKYGVGSYSLLQRIFPTQGLKLGLRHYRGILYFLGHEGSPKPTWLTLNLAFLVIHFGIYHSKASALNLRQL